MSDSTEESTAEEEVPFFSDPRFRRELRLVAYGGPLLGITLLVFAFFGPYVEPSTRVSLTFGATLNIVVPFELLLRLSGRPGIFKSAALLATYRPYRGIAVFFAMGTFFVTPIYGAMVLSFGPGLTGLLIALGIYLVIEFYVFRVAFGLARAAGGREVVVTDSRIYGPFLRPVRKLRSHEIRATLLAWGLGNRRTYDHLFAETAKRHRAPTAAEKAAFIEAFPPEGPEAELLRSEGIVDVEAIRGVLAGEIPIEWAIAYADAEAETPTLPGDDADGEKS